MPTKLILLFSLLGSGVIFSDKYTEIQGLPPVPKFLVKSTQEKIVVDGKLAEKVWAQTAPITLMFPWDFQKGKKQKTTVKLLRDNESLYVGYEVEDTDITAKFENRDDHTYEEDCVEIFIRPNQESGDAYFGLEMNARGTLFDYIFPFPHELDKHLNLEDVQIKTTIRGTLNKRDDQDQVWTLEVAIPFKDFANLTAQWPPKKGDQWRAQINRWEGVEDAAGRRLSMWCHSGMKDTNPHNPDRFGILVFE